MTSRRSLPVENMYSGRSARQAEQREGGPLSHLSSMSRRPDVFVGDDTRVNRGKAVEEDRLGRDIRVTGFLGKPRGGAVEQSDRSDVYSTIERRSFRDDGVLKVVRADDPPLRGESGRFRDGATRVERAPRSAAYEDEPKWIRNGNYDSLNYETVGSLRGSDYAPKSTSERTVLLPGFIYESYKRLILDFFEKGNFGLLLDDRRLAEQVGPGTKIFMFDGSARELHGVFQAESYPTIDVDAGSLRGSEGTALRISVRVAKECLPLTERQLKDIIQDNYYSNSKFSASLSKEQVAKLLHTFRSADAGRSVHLSLTAPRRTLDSGLSQSSQEFHSVSEDIAYRKDDRWRRGAVETRSFNSNSYIAQDPTRFPSKLSVQTHSSKVLDDFDDYRVDEAMENIPLSTSRLVSGSNLYSSSSGKQQSLRGLSGSRACLNHIVGSVGRSELKLGDGDWREEIDPRDLVYRKRQQLSPSLLDDLKRRDRSSSPPWKEVHSRVEATVSEIYERPGKVGYKDEVSFLSSRRRRHNDIDLNIPLDMGHGEPSHVHDAEPKAVKRRVWEEEDEKGYSVSPSKGRSRLAHAPALHLSDHLLASDVADDYDDSRLDSRHMINLSRKDLSILQTHEKGRAGSSSFSNGKLSKLHQRAATGGEIYLKDKSVLNPGLRKKGLSRDIYGKESESRSSKVPVFKIKASLQAPPGRGKPERVVTLVNSSHQRTRLDGTVDKDGFRPWGSVNSDEYGNGNAASQGRKRKASVWSRINLPGKGLRQRAAGLHGKGRVFSRLGPGGKASFDARDDTFYAYKKKKPWPPQTQLQAASEGAKIAIVDASDAREGEEYLNEEVDASVEEDDKEVQKAADDLHGWTRKKALVVAVNSGDESVNPDQADYAYAKGGRRKLDLCC